MAKITTVNKARKDQGNCTMCGTPITAGKPYNWSRDNRFVPPVKWHADCPTPRPSRLEGNDKRAAVLAAQEEAHDKLDDLANGDPADVTDSEIMQVLADCAEAIREVAGEYEEAAEAMGDGFGDEVRERADTLNGSADDLEGFSVTERPEDDDDDEGDDEGEDDDLAAWLDAAIDEARSALDDIEIP